MTIVEFLNARLEQDRGEAQYALNLLSSDRAPVMLGSLKGAIVNSCESVLADVAAKRAIIAEHRGEQVASLDSGTWGQVFIACSRCRIGERQIVTPCPTLKHLASVYSTHSDYQQDWKP